MFWHRINCAIRQHRSARPRRHRRRSHPILNIVIVVVVVEVEVEVHHQHIRRHRRTPMDRYLRTIAMWR